MSEFKTSQEPSAEETTTEETADAAQQVPYAFENSHVEITALISAFPSHFMTCNPFHQVTGGGSSSDAVNQADSVRFNIYATVPYPFPTLRVCTYHRIYC